jgi:hypothetical protein
MLLETGEDLRRFVCPCGIAFDALVWQGEFRRITIQGDQRHSCPEAIDELTEILVDNMNWRRPPSELRWRAAWALEEPSGIARTSQLRPEVARALAELTREQSERQESGSRGASGNEGGGVVSRPPETPSGAPKPLPRRKVLTRRDRTSAMSAGPDLVLPSGPPRSSAPVEPWGADCDPRCSADRHYCRRPARVGLATLTKVVYRGVDSLYWCAHAELNDNLLAALEVEKARARDGERILRQLGGVMWQVGFNSGGRRHPYRLENEFAILGLAKKSREGKTIKTVPAIKLTIKCEFMCEAGVKGAWEWARGFARAIHCGPGEPEEITSRLDMCVDVVGADFGATDIHEFVMRARKVTRHRDGLPDEDFEGMAESFVKRYATRLTDVQEDMTGLVADLTRFAELRAEARARARLRSQMDSWRQAKKAAPEDARAWARDAARKVVRVKKESEASDTGRIDKPGMRAVLAKAFAAHAGKSQDEDRYAGEHFSAREITGYSFGRSEVSMRIYDKTREIREQSRHKTWLYSVWARSGWVASETVWRVEVQLRRDALKELLSRETGAKLDLDSLGRAATPGKPLEGPASASGDSPEASPRSATTNPTSGLTGSGLLGALPSLWAYMVGGRRGHTAWLKWCVPNPNDKKRANWKIRAEWRIVQEADWGLDKEEPLLRFRVRQARYTALLGQLAGLGTMLSALRGTMENGQAPDLYDIQADVDRYYRARGTNWDTVVNEKRVDAALWDMVFLQESEETAKKALAYAVEMSADASTTDTRNLTKKAWARAKAEAN